jgi:hypothetical protein
MLRPIGTRGGARARLLVAAGLVGMIAAVTGCGGGGALHRAPQAAYPEQEYLVAVGSSVTSQAEADARARSALAAQIRSSIDATLRTESRATLSEGRIQESATTVQQLEQSAGFSHGELIRLDAASGGWRDGQYRAVAYLSRREAGEVLRRQSANHAAEFARRAAAVDAVGSGDLPGFAAAYGEARESWVALQQTARELRAVTGRDPADLAADNARWDALQRRRQAMFAEVRVALQLREPRPAGDRLDRQYLRQALITALTDLGLTVRGDSCADADYVVDLQPRLRYQGVVGVVCSLELAGVLRECTSGNAWDLHLTHPTWTGEGRNAYVARNQAAGSVTPATLTPPLLAALATSLPVR